MFRGLAKLRQCQTSKWQLDRAHITHSPPYHFFGGKPIIIKYIYIYKCYLDVWIFLTSQHPLICGQSFTINTHFILKNRCLSINLIMLFCVTGRARWEKGDVHNRAESLGRLSEGGECATKLDRNAQPSLNYVWSYVYFAVWGGGGDFRGDKCLSNFFERIHPCSFPDFSLSRFIFALC